MVIMRLNPDCIRDILLYCEENCDGRSGVRFEPVGELPNSLKKYSNEEVYYHANQCRMMDFFVNPSVSMHKTITFTDITPQAHEFIANIREDTIWNKVKDKSKKIGATSLSAMVQIASGVITQLISNNLGNS